LLLAAVAAAVGGPAIAAVFGHAYTGAGVLLALLVIGPAAAAMTTAAGVVLTSSGHQRAAMLGSLVVADATIGAEFGLGSFAHANGVAIGSAAGSVAQAGLMAVLAWRLVGVRTWPGAAFSNVLRGLRGQS
jgi:O-antigen/teichoic acid export membrane protein